MRPANLRADPAPDPRKHLLIVFLSLLLATPASAFWPVNGALVCGAAGDQFSPAIVSDGAGGAIICWRDPRGQKSIGLGSVNVPYIQRITAAGTIAPAWTPDGSPVANLSNFGINQSSTVYPAALSADGSGGAFVVWRSNGPRAQHFLGSGTPDPAWPDTGLVLDLGPWSLSARGYDNFVLAPDGAGGWFVAWSQNESGGNAQLWTIYLQRFTSSGSLAPGWSPLATKISANSGAAYDPQLLPDRSGGAYVGWTQSGTSPFSPGPGKLRLLRVAADGQPAPGWPIGGKYVWTTNASQGITSLEADSVGGCLVFFGQTTVASGGDFYSPDVFVIRVNGDTTLAWGGGPLRLSTTGSIGAVRTAADGIGGAFAVWEDDAQGAYSTHIYAQRVLSAGATVRASPIRISTSTSNQTNPRPAPDGQGGIIVAYDDSSCGCGELNSDLLRAQHVLPDVSVAWAPKGISVCSIRRATGMVAAEVGPGGIIAAWSDERDYVYPDFHSDIYAARIDPNGVTGPTPVLVGNFSAVSTPGVIELSWRTYGGAGARFEVQRSGAVQPRVYQTIGEAGPVPMGDGSNYTFSDRRLVPGQPYSYRILSGSGTAWSLAGQLEVSAAQGNIGLSGPWPDPSHGSLSFTIQLNAPDRANVDILDAQGRVVKRLLAGEVAAAVSSMTWDGRDDRGRRVASGIYFVRLRAAAGTRVARFVRL